MNMIYLILLYAIVCTNMIIFNLIAFLLKTNSNNFKFCSFRKIKHNVDMQLEKIANKEKIDNKHLIYLKKILKKSYKLLTYDKLLEMYLKKEKKYINTYIEQISPVIIELLKTYLKKDNVELAFYLNFIEHYNILTKNKNKEIYHTLNNLLQMKSSYCRNYAYLIICNTFFYENITYTFKTLSNSNKYFHSDFLLNGLKLYKGNTNLLIDDLISNFENFNSTIKITLIKYISDCNVRYNEFIYETYKNNRTKIVVMECIKYFEKNYYKPFFNDLLKKEKKDFIDNDYKQAYIKALRNYNCEESIRILIKQLNSTDNRIKNIAYESLSDLELNNHNSLKKFLNGKLENDNLLNYYLKKNKKVEIS